MAMLDVYDTHNLSVLPETRYLTSRDVSELCEVKLHELTYWEEEFPQLRMVSCRGNKKLYVEDDIAIVLQIRELLHQQGFTISGAKQRLGIEFANRVAKKSPSNHDEINLISSLIKELEDLHRLLDE